MLVNARVLVNIPVIDLERAKTFYTQKLGLKIFMEPMPGIAIVQSGEGNQLLLYQREPSKADHTLATFIVDDVKKVVMDLKSKGVLFESYDTGQIKTDENNIASTGQSSIAWFRDSEGNILGLTN